MDESLKDSCPNPDNPEYVTAWSRYISLKDQVIAKERALREEYGDIARLDRFELIEARLQMILNTLMPMDTIERPFFEIKWFELMQQSLEGMHNTLVQMKKEAQAEANRQKLLLPGGFRLPGQ